MQIIWNHQKRREKKKGGNRSCDMDLELCEELYKLHGLHDEIARKIMMTRKGKFLDDQTILKVGSSAIFCKGYLSCIVCYRKIP